MMSHFRPIIGRTTMPMLSSILLSAPYVLQRSLSCVSCYYQFEFEIEVGLSVVVVYVYLAGVCGAVGPVQRIHGEIQ